MDLEESARPGMICPIMSAPMVDITLHAKAADMFDMDEIMDPSHDRNRIGTYRAPCIGDKCMMYRVARFAGDDKFRLVYCGLAGRQDLERIADSLEKIATALSPDPANLVVD